MNNIHKNAGYFRSFDGTSLYYEERGSGEPLILVYGIACLINHWHHQIEYFSQTKRVIAFDLRGHHKSSYNAVEELNVDTMAKDVVALMDHLGLEQAHLLGHSFGVPILIQADQYLKKRALSYTFINGFAKNPIKEMFGLNIVEPLFYFMKTQHDQNPDLWKTLWKTAVDNPLSAYAAALAGGFNLKVTHFKDIEAYVRGVARMDLNVFIKLFEDLMIFNGEDLLKEILSPTLVISGEKDAVTPLRFQYYLHEHTKNSEYVLVPYGSHCTQLDFPEYVNLKIETFYSKI